MKLKLLPSTVLVFFSLFLTSTTVHAEEDARLVAGEKAYKGICFSCHDAGVAGAPKLLDNKEDWTKRLENGEAAIVESVIKGKGAMPPKGGSQLSDEEIGDAVYYMLKTAGVEIPKATETEADKEKADATEETKPSDEKTADSK